MEKNEALKISPLEAAIDILHRLPPHRIEENLENVCTLLSPEDSQTLRNTIDVPAKSLVCPKTSREYLICEYNRHGNSYRSPWSNQYYKYDQFNTEHEVENDGENNSENDQDDKEEADDDLLGPKPSERLRKLEIIANNAFDTYRSLYYENGSISSVYIWDVPSDKEGNENFTVAILIKKVSAPSERLNVGTWDSLHIIEVSIDGIDASYQLTTTITLQMDANMPGLDQFILAGNIIKESKQQTKLRSSEIEQHVPIMGRMVEEMESRMRSSLQEIYFGKTHDIINEIRPTMPAGYLRNQVDLQRDLATILSAGGASILKKKIQSTCNNDSGEAEKTDHVDVEKENEST